MFNTDNYSILIYLGLLIVVIAAFYILKANKNQPLSEEEKLELQSRLKTIHDKINDFLKKDSYIYDYEIEALKDETTIECKYLLDKKVITKEDFNTIRLKIAGIEAEVLAHNNAWSRTNIELAYDVVGNVEGQKLDFQQMECIVKNPHNQLVIAGAGTGKTTTIIGKIKYLLGNHMVTPNEILVLSYTNAAASEMAERLERETYTHIAVSTFHKLGLNILTIVNHVKPDIYSGGNQDYIADVINECMHETSFSNFLLEHLLYGKAETDQSFKSREDYLQYLKANPPETIKGEKVKSFGEVMIANFLAGNNINYLYEEKYKFNTRDENFGQYRPDFYLPDFDIYIEYFGIDRKGNVAPFFKSQNGKSASVSYNEGIKWKRNLHKTNNTTLIECYSYEQFEGILLSELEKKLTAKGVVLEPLSFEAIVEKAGKNLKKYSEAFKLDVRTIIGLAKGRNMKPAELIEFAKNNCLSQYFLAQCASKILEKYQARLISQNEVDFSDMLNLAREAVVNGTYKHTYKYVIIDEYQDLIRGQFNLLKAMREQNDFTLFAVGDDWQSIYRFSGSDINYILDFSTYWGDSEISRIEKTYRFSQNLVDVSGGFVMSNPRQYRKQISSGIENIVDACRVINADTEEFAINKMVDEIISLPKNSSIFFIGRYNWDRKILSELDGRLSLKYHTAEQKSEIIIAGRPDLRATFYTAHKSKGLQADYVFLINVKSDIFGFPSLITSSKLIEALLEKGDEYPFSEERRLFYVAITRARKKMYLLNIKSRVSPFVQELEEKYPDRIMRYSGKICPLCNGELVKRKGSYGYFYGCINYSKTGCKYTENCP